MSFSTDDINTFIETQLDIWPETRRRFEDLRGCRRRQLLGGDLAVFAQHNPGRIRSTAAAVDNRSVAARPCFLCRANRPAEQMSLPLLDGWEMLLNPYPILPVHFTIVSTGHTPQSRVPLEMAAMAELAPDLAIFFNGARAGASAPDHLHAQGVLKSELPLVRLVEKHHDRSRGGFVSSEDFDATLPFHFISGIITPDASGAADLLRCEEAFGVDAETGRPDTGLVNAFFWLDPSGLLRVVLIPRRRHRPARYYGDADSRMLVSPGALDMAGLIILPEGTDFDRITPGDACDIYAETAFAGSLPGIIRQHFRIR